MVCEPTANSQQPNSVDITGYLDVVTDLRSCQVLGYLEKWLKNVHFGICLKYYCTNTGARLGIILVQRSDSGLS